MPTIDVDINKIVQILYEALIDPVKGKIEPIGSGRITLDPFDSDEIREHMQSIIAQRASLGQCVACGRDIHTCLDSPCRSETRRSRPRYWRCPKHYRPIITIDRSSNNGEPLAGNAYCPSQTFGFTCGTKLIEVCHNCHLPLNRKGPRDCPVCS